MVQGQRQCHKQLSDLQSLMNKTSLKRRHPYIRSLEPKGFAKNKHCKTISCSTQLPPITREFSSKINQSISVERKNELSSCQYVPKRLPEAEDLIKSVLKNNLKPDREPREKTLIDIKKELIKIINEKRKEASLFRNGQIKMKWEIEKEAKKLRQNEERRDDERELKFKQEERQRLLMVLKRRRLDQRRFLEVGKKGFRQILASNSWGSQEFLKTEIDELKSKLRSECINVLRQKDSFYSSMGRVSTANPEDM